MNHESADWPAKLDLDPTAFIAPGAVVVGEVRLGARSSVWFNTVLRGDTDRIEVGDETNVQDNSTVHMDAGQPALIGARVTVGHRAIIHGCVIGDDSLVGMGAVVLSGATIGAGSLVGAGALVREGQVLPPGSLAVGAPARVIGPVADTHREAIARGTRHYVELSRSYLARGFARPHAARDSVTGITSRAAGPMTWEEWGRLLGALGGMPDWVEDRLVRHGEAAFRARPGEERWSAHETLCHVSDGDARVFAPRLEAMLRADGAWFEVVPLPSFAAGGAYFTEATGAALSEFRERRHSIVARLAPLGRADWARWGTHQRLGPLPLSEMVRGWVEHDLSHRAQIARALGESA
jgi:carbonic anhydrase/acetyltransferase-like protein (isoleucine patch superfamily)